MASSAGVGATAGEGALSEELAPPVGSVVGESGEPVGVLGEVVGALGESVGALGEPVGATGASVGTLGEAVRGSTGAGVSNGVKEGDKVGMSPPSSMT